MDIIISLLLLLLNNSVSGVLLFYLDRPSGSLGEVLQLLVLAACVGLASWLQAAVVVDLRESQQMALSSVRDLMQAFVTRNNSSTMQIGQEWSCYAMIPVMVATLEAAVACTTVFVQLLKSLLLFVNIEWFQDSTVATCQGHWGSCGSHDSQLLLLSLRWQLSIAFLSASLLPPFCCLYCLWNDCFEFFLHTSSSHRSTAISQEKTTQEKPFYQA